MAAGIASGMVSGMDTTGGHNQQKVHENRLREKAKRQGLELGKSRRRDPDALDYGTYKLVEADTGEVVADGLTDLASIEAALTRSKR
jgi:hypothetical protein